MIVTWGELPSLSGRVVMVDGSFDPLHDGHIAYFEAASSLGQPVLCNITTDGWTNRKHPVLLPQTQRARVIDAIRHVSYVHCATSATWEVLEHLRPIAYLKGADWRDRGGIPGKEAEICQKLQIAVHYLDTVLNSSTKLIDRIRASS